MVNRYPVLVSHAFVLSRTKALVNPLRGRIYTLGAFVWKLSQGVSRERAHTRRRIKARAEAAGARRRAEDGLIAGVRTSLAPRGNRARETFAFDSNEVPTHPTLAFGSHPPFGQHPRFGQRPTAMCRRIGACSRAPLFPTP